MSDSRYAVIGVDPSSRKIAATVTRSDNPAPEMYVWALPPGKPVEACLLSFVKIRGLVKQYADQGYAVYFFIEEPVLGRGGAKATIPQSKTHGAMLAGAASVTGTTVQGVNNQTAKKRVTGNGNASKDQIRLWCKTCWPSAYAMADGDQDLMDSAMINRHGQKVIDMLDHVAGRKTTTTRILRKSRR